VEPLGSLTRALRLRLDPKGMDDGRIGPRGSLRSSEKLEMRTCDACYFSFPAMRITVRTAGPRAADAGARVVRTAAGVVEGTKKPPANRGFFLCAEGDLNPHPQ
jgi:hypothetical protein